MAPSNGLSTYHPRLKVTFQGLQHPNSASDADVTQYRGIKFASIPARWRRAQLFEEYQDQYDATKHGPAAPQAALPVAMEDMLNGFSEEQIRATGIAGPKTFDEFECLNLVITAPKGATADSKMPVMICIPGGGNVAGANSSWFNDAGALVAKSIQLGKRVLCVALNYRLGFLGFMASEELKLYNNEAGDVGVGNYGMHDVHLGIEWVYRNIAPFGGDPGNITLQGESAGSIDTMLQIHAQVPPRFCRAILQSGIGRNAVMDGPISIEEQSKRAELVKRATKADSLESLQRLATSDFARVAHQITPWGSMPCNATIDGVLFDERWFERRKLASAAPIDFLIGDVKYEASLFEVTGSLKRRFQPNQDPPLSTPEFVETACKAAPESKAQRILSAYDIQPQSFPEHVQARLWWIINDMNFAYLTQDYAVMALSNGGTVYRYLFDERNPFGGRFKGQANHALDLAYLYGTRSTFEAVDHPEWEASVQDAVQEKWISFAYGEQVWKPLSQGGYFAFGPEGEVGEITREEVERRRRADKWETFAGLSMEQYTDFVTACAKHLFTLL